MNESLPCCWRWCCACAWRPAELGENGNTETTAPAAQESEIWSMEALAGVEHEGYFIKADSATADQVLVAAAAQSYPAVKQEGCEYLYRYVLYFDMTDENGAWYYPAEAFIPADTDNVYYNSYNAVKGQCGNILVTVQVNTWGLGEEEKEQLRSTPGWEELTDVQLQLCYALHTRLTEDGLSIDSEGVSCAFSEDSILGMWDVETEQGTKQIMAQFYIMTTGTDGQSAVGLVEIQGPAAVSAEEDSDYYMTEEDTAVLTEVMYFYALDEWFE